MDPQPSTDQAAALWRRVEAHHARQLIVEGDGDVLEALALWAVELEELALATRAALHAAVAQLAALRRQQQDRPGRRVAA